MKLIAIALAAAIQSPADKAIDAAVAAYAKIKTARASFEQTITNPLLGNELKSRGTFEQERPNRFAFRFSEPKGDVIVSDGKHVWIYLPNSAPGQVIRESQENNAAGSLDLIGEFFTNPRNRYAISDGGAATVTGRAVRIVRLTPKERDAAFVRAKVWIDASDGSLVQFEAEESSGITRHVRITSFTPNAAVTATAFVFTPPKGVRIIDSKTIR